MSAETAAVLDEAANVIRRNGWHQGGYFAYPPGFGTDDIEPPDCPVCLLGAIGVAGGPGPEHWYDSPEGRDAALAIGRYLGIDLEPDGYPLDFGGDSAIEYMADHVGTWNDWDGREAEQVIAVLEGAARAEREAAS